MTYIGIDGGGTRTTAVAISRDGRELARIEGGAGLVRSSNPTAGAALLADLADRVLTAAGLAPPATALCCALAGAGRPDDRIAIAAALQREAIAERVRVVSDAEAAFHDAFSNGPGILLIAGTGSVALGRNQGKIVQVGGWGKVLGDEGSGYSIGKMALRYSVRSEDRRAPETALLPMILDQLRLDTAADLIPWSENAAKPEVAALAPLVIRAAEDGDELASELIDHATRELVLHLETLEKRLGPWASPPSIALAGGLIGLEGPLRPYLVRRIEARHTRGGGRTPDLQGALHFGAAPRIAGGQYLAPGRGGSEPMSQTPATSAKVMDRQIDAARGAAELARES